MDEYYCPQCNGKVEGPPPSIPYIEIKCPHCGNVFHNRVDNKFDWSIDWIDEEIEAE